MATGDALSAPTNTDFMLHLERDQLTFTFPEIAWQLTALLEQHIQQLRPKFRLPLARTGFAHTGGNTQRRGFPASVR